MIVALDKNKNRVSISSALSNEKYFCQSCNGEMIQKRGSKRCHHFAHKKGSNCVDSKYYDTSEWHINWQNRFPEEAREVLMTNKFGEKRIADVFINNTVIEFQHSNLPFEIFNKRNEFYSSFGYKVIWVFDGNEIFNSGYQGGPLYFRKSLKCLREMKNIPEYLNIFVEGEIQFNLFDEEGLFLHHIGTLNPKDGISFDKRYDVDEFLNNVDSIIVALNNNSTNEPTTSSNSGNYQYWDTLVNICNKHKDLSQIKAYKPYGEYDVLLDADAIRYLNRGKQPFGYLKKHGNSYFPSSKTTIYDAFKRKWIDIN